MPEPTRLVGGHASPATSPKPNNQNPRRWKQFWFRSAAILFGLLPFLLAELGLRLASWVPATANDDPFVSFAAVKPLFVKGDNGQRYEIEKSRLGYFRPDSFDVRKSTNEFRIFCLGESTVQGNPWGIETAFSSWLELSLSVADPQRQWEVVNCGGISYASYRLRPILDELLNYEPDLIILYSGHNEFLEDRTYSKAKLQPNWLVRLHVATSNSRLYEFSRHQFARFVPRTTVSKMNLPVEVDTLLDYQDGLDNYRRDDDWQAAIVSHYLVNLQALVTRAQSANVPLILCNPVSNLKDLPPFKSQRRSDLNASDSSALERLSALAHSSDEIGIEERTRVLEEILAIDNRHAGFLYQLAKCYESKGRYDEANLLFLKAKDEDVCPLRMLETMHHAVLATARAHRVPLIDVRKLFESLSPYGIPGEELLVDHVHPTIRGHQLIAESIVTEMSRLRLLIARDNWQDERQNRYRIHLQALGAAYYARGKEHLEGLRRWSEGRAPKVRPGVTPRP